MIMLENEAPATKDDAIFIDRDPKHFRLILNFMRNDDVDFSGSELELKEILKEAQHYRLDDLVKLCEAKLQTRISENIVKLNIGGTVFQTKKSMLTKYNGLLKKMLENEVPITLDESGAIFIDRPSTYFNQILNFMIDGDVELPNSPHKCQEIQNDAKFYQLDELVKLCGAKLKFRSFGNIVKLNIGGTLFEASKSTLTKYDGFFNTLLETDVPTIVVIHYSPIQWTAVFSNTSAESVAEKNKNKFEIYFINASVCIPALMPTPPIFIEIVLNLKREDRHADRLYSYAQDYNWNYKIYNQGKCSKSVAVNMNGILSNLEQEIDGKRLKINGYKGYECTEAFP